MSEQPSTRKIELIDPELYSHYRNCDRWAVIVGVSKYQYPNLTLRYADRDAEELYKLLLTSNGGGFQSDHICKLTNEQATTGNITRALRSFLKKPAREDLVLIYFACHGSPDPDRPGNVYLLTYDTDPNDIAGTALPMDDIDRALKTILHSEKVIILADTCHSAAIGGGIGGRRSVVDDSKLMNRFLQEISRSKGGVALLTSAESNEVSFEDAKWGGGHGVFTYYLLKGMRGAADLDSNGIVTIGELFEYVRDNVKKSTEYRQHPSIGTNAYDRTMPVSISSSPATAGTCSIDTPVSETLTESVSRQRIVSQSSPPVQPVYRVERVTSLKAPEVVVSIEEKGDHPSQPVESQREALGQDISLELVSIPGGTFQMGSLEGQGSADEKPQHQVTIKPFLMGKYPVTQAQWKAVAALPKVAQDLASEPANFKGDNCPVEQVSWDDAVEFCKRLSQKTGRDYRLPSEAEWEYACRAGIMTSFYFGEKLTPKQAQCKSNIGMVILTTFSGQTAPVGSFPANSFGLYDMHGNVLEWCLDHWHRNYDGAPTDGSAWVSGGDSSKRLLRGGSWVNYPGVCRSPARLWGARDDRKFNVGFRAMCASL